MRTSFAVTAALTAASVAVAGAMWAASSAGERQPTRGIGAAGMAAPAAVAPGTPAPAMTTPAMSAVIRSTERALAGESPTPTPTLRPRTSGTTSSPTPAKVPARAGRSSGTTAHPAPTSAPRPTYPPSSASTTQPSSIENAVFEMLNQERAANGLAALRWSNAVAVSAARHNGLMDANNTLSHQFRGEGDLPQRMSAAGFHGSTWGENVGESPQTDENGALGLEQLMYDEPPSGPHRQNILSRSFSYVGISVIIDGSTGSLWLTVDFGG